MADAAAEAAAASPPPAPTPARAHAYVLNLSRRTFPLLDVPDSERSERLGSLESLACAPLVARCAVGGQLWLKLDRGWLQDPSDASPLVDVPPPGECDALVATGGELQVHSAPSAQAWALGRLPAHVVVRVAERAVTESGEAWLRLASLDLVALGEALEPGVPVDGWVQDGICGARSARALTPVLPADGVVRTYRNVFPKRVPIRADTDTGSAVLGVLPPYTVLKGKRRVVAAGGRVFVQLAEFTPQPAWVIERSTKDGALVLEPCEGPDRAMPRPRFYRNVYSKGGLPVRATPALQGEVLGRLSMGRVVEAAERRLTQQGHMWIRLRDFDSFGDQGWIIERNARDGSEILVEVAGPSAEGRQLYQSTHQGRLPLLDAPQFTGDTATVGHLEMGEVVVVCRRHQNQRGEMWLQVADDESASTWVAESFGGVATSLRLLEGVEEFDAEVHLDATASSVVSVVSPSAAARSPAGSPPPALSPSPAASPAGSPPPAEAGADADADAGAETGGGAGTEEDERKRAEWLRQRQLQHELRLEQQREDALEAESMREWERQRAATEAERREVMRREYRMRHGAASDVRRAPGDGDALRQLDRFVVEERRAEAQRRLEMERALERARRRAEEEQQAALAAVHALPPPSGGGGGRGQGGAAKAAAQGKRMVMQQVAHVGGAWWMCRAWCPWLSPYEAVGGESSDEDD